MSYKIDFNEDACLGCGACTMCDNWELSSEGKVRPLQVDIDSVGCNEQASEICPVDAIKIVKK